MIGSSSAIISAGRDRRRARLERLNLPSLRTSGRHPRRQSAGRRPSIPPSIETADRSPGLPAGAKVAERSTPVRRVPAGPAVRRRVQAPTAGGWRRGAPSDRVGDDADGDLLAVAEDRHLERAIRRRVIEFDRVSCGRRRRACSGMIGPTSCRISWRVSGWLDASCGAPAVSMIFAGLPTASRRPLADVSVIIFNMPSTALTILSPRSASRCARS